MERARGDALDAESTQASPELPAAFAVKVTAMTRDGEYAPVSTP